MSEIYKSNSSHIQTIATKTKHRDAQKHMWMLAQNKKNNENIQQGHFLANPNRFPLTNSQINK